MNKNDTFLAELKEKIQADKVGLITEGDHHRIIAVWGREWFGIPVKVSHLNPDFCGRLAIIFLKGAGRDGDN